MPGCSSATAGDHPRVCGENSCPAITCPPPEGSPPRVRGKHTGRTVNVKRRGITPACAGKTLFGGNRPFRYRDHPRVCGENRILAQFVPACPGSPPRVRGKRTRTRVMSGRRGITPACAGKTYQQEALRTEGRDHPRVCGENKIAFVVAALVEGSPPRVRGKPAVAVLERVEVGITPACAGKT